MSWNLSIQSEERQAAEIRSMHACAQQDMLGIEAAMTVVSTAVVVANQTEHIVQAIELVH